MLIKIIRKKLMSMKKCVCPCIPPESGTRLLQRHFVGALFRQR